MWTVGIKPLTSRLPKHIESEGKPKLAFPARGGRLHFSGGTRRSRERKEDELDAVPSQPSGPTSHEAYRNRKDGTVRRRLA
ncbi:hypothetical protein CGGC5_v013384 [Colletotrichum fructicola Nara gc5]|uniref:Uncharacterized protein n=1 Tax=Colletotrichum fructicola (strain Nara gc5) TaxID=1213859 RepID=A0A7J6INV5_COLFN|nr:hypothetical protein CGGC5_v013384 [Colletotrichum fructicola Nara gc5]